jgi:hypothetical protein
VSRPAEIDVLQLREATRQLRVRGEHFAQPQKRTHHIDAHLDGFRAIQHIGRLNGAVLGEGVSQVSAAAATGRSV